MSSYRIFSAALLAVVATGCGNTESVDATEAVEQASSAGGIASLSLSSTTITAGSSVAATVTLARSAQSSAGGVIVYVAFRDATLAGPKFIRIPNGLSSGTFTLHSDPFLSAPASAAISASTSTPQPASFLSQSLSIVPSPSAPATTPPQVSSLTLSPATVTSGSASTGTVTLSEPAPAGGAVVQLRNSNDFFNLDADLPAVVVVPEGDTRAAFTVRTHLSNTVASFAQALIVGNYFGGVFQGAALTIDAP